MTSCQIKLTSGKAVGGVIRLRNLNIKHNNMKYKDF